MVTRPAMLKAKRRLMEVLVNGEFHTFEEGINLADMLIALGLPLKKIAVERNLEVVPKSTYADVTVTNGDKIEIIHFIGGG